MASRGATFDEQGPLPPGWKTKIDPKKERRFYYNREKDVTSWHRPKFEDGSGPGPAPAPAPQPQARAPVQAQAPAPAPVPKWEPEPQAILPRATMTGGNPEGRKVRVKAAGHLEKEVGSQVVEIDVTDTDTVMDMKVKIELKMPADAAGKKKLHVDQQVLYGNYELGTKLDSRTTMRDIIKNHRDATREACGKTTLGQLKQAAQSMGATASQLMDCDHAPDPKLAAIELYVNKQIERGIQLEVDLSVNTCGCSGKASCCEWTCVCMFASLGIFFISCLLAIGAAVFYKPEDVGQFQHYLFIGSFFGVMGTCSMVCFIARLLPRYTGKRGVWWSQDKLNKLSRETWIWSFALNGQAAKVKVLVALWLSGIKFAQLFTLTYDPAAISGLPDWAIQVGEYTLFNFEELLEDQNSTANVAIDDVLALGETNNLTAGATQALAAGFSEVTGFVTGEDAYRNYFVLYAGICVAVLLLVCICWPCLNGTGSESWERKATLIVGTIQGFVAIPIYTHLLAGLDCTYEETGFGPYLNESGFRWDGATDAFGFQSDTQLQATILGDQTVDRDHQLISEEQAKGSCYGEWGSPGDMDEWTAFNYMIFGMIAICVFHWPVSLYLMAKNDSERDDNEAVTLIIDAIIRAKNLSGRHIKGAGGEYIAPGGDASAQYIDNWDNLYENRKKCCKARARRIEYVGTQLSYIPRSKAAEQSETLWRVDPDEQATFHKKCKQLQEKLGREITREDIRKAKIKHPERVPAKNRVEIRKYALNAGVPESEIDSIDHRHKCFWQVRDLDSAQDGVKGPKKRPREAAVNFGMEVAIVVISALFSGDGVVSDVYVGSYCKWPAPDDQFAGVFTELCGELVSEEQCAENGRLSTDPEADVCTWSDRPLTVMEVKLGCLAVLHLLMAIYFCNPVTLLCGEVCCSPYRDKQQTDSRTTVCAMGYPYNYEPLNFLRGAMSLICSSFAVFEILSYRRTFHDQDNILENVQLGFQFGGEDDENVGLAMQYWVYSCFGITALYLLMMIVRWCVFRRHSSKSKEAIKERQRQQTMAVTQP